MITPVFLHFLEDQFFVTSGTLLATFLFIVFCRRKPWIRIFWWSWMILSGLYVFLLVVMFLGIPGGPDGGWVAMGFMFILMESFPIIIFFVALWIVRSLITKEKCPKISSRKKMAIMTSYILVLAVAYGASSALTWTEQRRNVGIVHVTLVDLKGVPIHNARAVCNEHVDPPRKPMIHDTDNEGSMSVEFYIHAPLNITITKNGYRPLSVRLERGPEWLVWVSWTRRDGTQTASHHVSFPFSGTITLYLPKEDDPDDLPYRFAYLEVTASNMTRMLFNGEWGRQYSYWHPIQLDVDTAPGDELKRRIAAFKRRSDEFQSRVSEKVDAKTWRMEDMISVERNIVSIIDVEGVEDLAADFARNMVTSLEERVQFTESYLRDNPETPLAPYLLLFLLHENQARAQHGGERFPGEKRDAIIRQLEQYQDPLVTFVGKALAQ